MEERKGRFVFSYSVNFAFRCSLRAVFHASQALIPRFPIFAEIPAQLSLLFSSIPLAPRSRFSLRRPLGSLPPPPSSPDRFPSVSTTPPNFE